MLEDFLKLLGSAFVKLWKNMQQNSVKLAVGKMLLRAPGSGGQQATPVEQ